MLSPVYILSRFIDRPAKKDSPSKEDSPSKKDTKTKLTKASEMVFLALPPLDYLASITLIVMGVLGATHVLALSPAASYAMIGCGAANALGWMTYLGLIIRAPLAPSKKVSS